MSPEPDFYDVLGVSSSADEETIKRAYRDKMRRFHPDSLVGQMAKARASGDLKNIRNLERLSEEAKQKTQQFNRAYETLSDASKRQTYDLRRAGVPQQRGSAYDADADPYRAGPYAARSSAGPSTTQRAAPRPQPKPPVRNDAFPYILFVVLGVGLVFVFASLVAFSNLPAPGDGLPIINDGRISAADLQSTTTMRESTRIAWTQAALLPTATLRTIEDELRAGDYFLAQQQYGLAIELYSNAIDRGLDTAQVYLNRGTALRLQGNPDQFGQAIADFTRAIQLMPNLADAWRGRAEVNFALWQTTQDAVLVTPIRDDIAEYTRLTGVQDARLTEIANSLP